MNTVMWLLIVLTLFLVAVIGYYYFIEKPRVLEKMKSNVIQLQSDGIDFILYKGKIIELISDNHRYLAKMDIVVYSKSLYIGFLEQNKTYIEIPAKAIQSVKYEPNKATVFCYKEYAGTKKITIKANSTKELYQLAKKIDFILRRSKKLSAI